ncbi:hypothetical protein [Deinococcus sp. AJ005]|uniref:hypothetical protein n=1 Tax=Deinococcus sp. AJ005 TaxID=2652443 RepID=UPI00125CB817|nr:hypothetical protein [Deinococcus sp. AJ005]QFP76277.1 hypothetical protein DAAJ005_07300 [Deinococcus sp. AJ005]
MTIFILSTSILADPVNALQINYDLRYCYGGCQNTGEAHLPGVYILTPPTIGTYPSGLYTGITPINNSQLQKIYNDTKQALEQSIARIQSNDDTSSIGKEISNSIYQEIKGNIKTNQETPQGKLVAEIMIQDLLDSLELYGKMKTNSEYPNRLKGENPDQDLFLPQNSTYNFYSKSQFYIERSYHNRRRLQTNTLQAMDKLMSQNRLEEATNYYAFYKNLISNNRSLLDKQISAPDETLKNLSLLPQNKYEKLGDSSSLNQLYIDLKNAQAIAVDKNVIPAGIKAVKIANTALISGDKIEYEIARTLAISALEIGLGIFPVTSIPISAASILTGKSMFDGHELSDFEITTHYIALCIPFFPISKLATVASKTEVFKDIILNIKNFNPKIYANTILRVTELGSSLPEEKTLKMMSFISTINSESIFAKSIGNRARQLNYPAGVTNKEAEQMINIFVKDAKPLKTFKTTVYTTPQYVFRGPAIKIRGTQTITEFNLEVFDVMKIYDPKQGSYVLQRTRRGMLINMHLPVIGK